MEKDRDYVKECVVFIPLFFGAIALVGMVCDRLLDSKTKAEEARKQGHDI